MPAAEYSFVEQVVGPGPDGEPVERGVFSFCMCPGGILVPSSTEPETVVLNGMSNSSRNSRWANAGVVVSIEPGDEPELYKAAGAFSLLDFQHDVEKRMYAYAASKAAPGDNLLKADKLALVRKRVEKIRDSVRKSSGKDTKIIILAAPDPLSVYPEAAPDELYGKRGAVSRLDQYRTALSDVEGVVFLDVRAEMQQNRDVGRLYYQTDTHWTETGAYFGYRAITDAISADFPSVTPYPFNAFKAETVEAAPGDLAGFADLHGISERITVLRPVTRQRAVGLPEKPDTIDRSVYGGELTSAVNDDSLPVAVMIRDSYSANLFPLIGEHFSFLYAQSMWRYDPEYKKIAEYAPDYVIFVICERNLGIWE